MEPRRTLPECTLRLTTDRQNLKDTLKALLHTIFFHRYFTPLYPATHEVLDLTLPYVSDDEIETLIETKLATLSRQLDSTISTTRPNPSSHPQPTIVIQFLEKRRRKGWFGGKADEELPWENWIIELDLLKDSTTTSNNNAATATTTRSEMEASLQQAVLKVLAFVGSEKGHIPPITTNEANPFPYQILVNPSKGEGGGYMQKIGGYF